MSATEIMGVFDKWLMINAALDWVPLGIVPILGLDPLPGPKIEDFFDGPVSLAHRQCAWFFMTAGCARFAAGYDKTTAAKKLALISYIFDARYAFILRAANFLDPGVPPL